MECQASALGAHIGRNTQHYRPCELVSGGLCSIDWHGWLAWLVGRHGWLAGRMCHYPHLDWSAPLRPLALCGLGEHLLLVRKPITLLGCLATGTNELLRRADAVKCELGRGHGSVQDTTLQRNRLCGRDVYIQGRKTATEHTWLDSSNSTYRVGQQQTVRQCWDGLKPDIRQAKQAGARGAPCTTNV